MPLVAALFPSPGPLLATLSPDGAVLLATLALGLIALELNRPGLILPGATGLLGLLLAASALLRSPLQPWAAVLLGATVVTLFANLWFLLPVWLLVLDTAAFAAALRWLVAPDAPSPVHTPVAVACGVLVGGLGAALSRIALRARRAKQVN